MNTFDDDGAILLGPLDHEPNGPCTVDIQRAVREGRRRHRRRRTVRYASVAVVAALALTGTSLAAGTLRDTDRADPSKAPTNQAVATSGAPAPPAASTSAPAPAPPTSCAIRRLPVPDGVDMALVTGADPTGRIIVGRSYPRGKDYQVILWRDGQATKIALGGSDATLTDVTTGGVAVGFTYERVAAGADGVRAVPYAYRDGTLAKLPGVRSGLAHGINETGRIAGVDGERGWPVVWPSPTTAAVALPLPAGAPRGEAYDIDEDGTVVGNLGERRAHVWLPDGTHRDLPLPKVNGVAPAGARVYSIRNGWATGVLSGTPMGEPSAVRWNVRTGEVRVFAELNIRASTANELGWQVGTDRQGRAAFLSDTGLLVLPDLATHRPNELTNIPTTLSDDGRTIAGQADDAAGTIHAVVWHCQ